MMINAKVIADSISNDNIRLTTLELHYPRFIHGQVMTHRVFSRNGRSSRALPVRKLLEEVTHRPAYPLQWGTNQPGMQAGDVLYGEYAKEANLIWQTAAFNMAHRVTELQELNIHKQIANRLLEPFQYMKLIVTATEWDNFFDLRLHEDSQPEIQQLAREMKKAMEESTPNVDFWHLPYALEGAYDLTDRIKSSVAGCARVSYDTHDSSKRTLEKDIALHDRLRADKHMSPFEHQAKPAMNDYKQRGVTHMDRLGRAWSNNFRGWIQYRALINEGGFK